MAEFGGSETLRCSSRRQVRFDAGLSYANPWYFPCVGEYAIFWSGMDFEVSAAWHFDRLTALDEGEDAMRDWIEMFGFGF